MCTTIDVFSFYLDIKGKKKHCTLLYKLVLKSLLRKSMHEVGAGEHIITHEDLHR